MTAGALFAPSAAAIQGGAPAEEPYSFMGSLQRPTYLPAPPGPDGHACGAMVVAPQWVLTASHCARNPTGAAVGTPREMYVRIGSLDNTRGGQFVEVDKFYRRGVEGDMWGKDIALLHLKTPVDGEPVELADKAPEVGTTARVLGWGSTCSDGENTPDCYPTKLREIDLEVQPIEACSPAVDGELCIGVRDGSIGPRNADSGGPALIRDDGKWKLAGVVSGSGSNEPTLFTDVTRHRDWINGIVSGTDVPPEEPMPSVAGSVNLGNCVGSVVRTSTARPDDPALLLTNGHCVEGKPPAPGSALVDRPADRDVRIADDEGYPKATATAVRLVYATMTGTDIALYRLDKTYAELEHAGARIFRLTDEPPNVGDQVDVLTTSTRKSCEIEAVVPHVREDGYQLDHSLRYAAAESCLPMKGDSGSPVLSGETVVAIHSSTNISGEKCTTDNPCEVAEDGTVTAEKGRSYAQQVGGIPPCLTKDSRIDLHRPGCALTRP